MTATAPTTPRDAQTDERQDPVLATLTTIVREKPIVPLILLLLLLVFVLWLVRPSVVTNPDGLLGLNDRWIANTVKFAIPLAILAASQTITMITGGIDLSVGFVASMAAYIMGTQAPTQDPIVAVALALGATALAGFVSGIGVGVFRVHPLIMTLAVGFVIVGLLQVYQRTTLGTGTEFPEAIVWLGVGLSWGIPNSLLVFVPLALLIGLGLKYSGYGRVLYAIGDNEHAARLSGVRVGPVLVVLYVISALVAGIGGLVYVGLIQSSTMVIAGGLLLPSVAAAVIGGTSIFGGRGGYAGTIVGALILQVMIVLLTVLQMPEGTRRIIFGLIVLAVTAAYVRVTGERRET